MKLKETYSIQMSATIKLRRDHDEEMRNHNKNLTKKI